MFEASGRVADVPSSHSEAGITVNMSSFRLFVWPPAAFADEGEPLVVSSAGAVDEDSMVAAEVFLRVPADESFPGLGSFLVCSKGVEGLLTCPVFITDGSTSAANEEEEEDDDDVGGTAVGLVVEVVVVVVVVEVKGRSVVAASAEGEVGICLFFLRE